MTPPASERGTALLTVLVLVAIIAVIAALSLERMRISTRQSINQMAMDQARAYGMAAEAAATARIADLVGQDGANMTLGAGLLGRDLPFPVDGGLARIRISDGGNCFNVNAVVTGQGDGDLVARPSGISQFEALMAVLEIPAGEARALAMALADWIDSDTVPLPGGAEDERYLRATPPYRTANTLMADVSEIRSLSGMTPSHYVQLRPWLCALPTTEMSPINVNTVMPDQAPLIAMLIPGRLDVATARRMIDARPQDGYGNVMMFWSLPALSGVTPSPEAIAQTRTRSRWFALDMTIELAGAELRETALLDGEKIPVRVVRRAYGDPL